MMLDTEHTERVEAELDRIIEKRAREARDAAAVEELWKQSEREHRGRRRRENRAAWYEFEMLLVHNHRKLSEDHEKRARALLELGEGAA